jgi:hypothetical protein
MNKKLILSVIMAGALTAAVVLQVIAGAVFDYGTLAGKTESDPPPPEGAVNWVAWHWTSSTGIPREILTEDSTNAEDGVDLGYSTGIIDPPDIVKWQLQIENFDRDPAPYDEIFGDHDPIYMVFGGLGENFSGTIWKYTIPYWLLTESLTNHGKVPIHTTEGAACPIIEAQPVTGQERTVYFSGEPDAFYHVYRSQNASTVGSNTSNGQYFWRQSVSTNESGLGSFTEVDTYDGQNWYLVIEADPGTNTIIGCHSEEGTPTNVRVFDFSAVYQPETHTVDLAWKTASELNIQGFNVLRSTSLTGERVKLNDTLIEAGPPGTLEGSYAFTDDDLGDAAMYYYWVEIVEFGGGREAVGPQSVEIINNGEPYKYYLPMILK